MYKRVNGNRLPIKYHVTPVSVNKILLFVFIYRENLGAVPTPGKYPGMETTYTKKGGVLEYRQVCPGFVIGNLNPVFIPLDFLVLDESFEDCVA